MAYVFEHSAVGSLLRFITKGNLSFERQPLKAFSDDIPSEEDLSSDANPEKSADDGGDEHLVTWTGPGMLPPLSPKRVRLKC